VVSTLEGETWALLVTIEEARYRALDRVKFKSNSKLLVDDIHMKCKLVIFMILLFLCHFVKILRLSLLGSKRIRLLILLLERLNFGLVYRFEIIHLCIKRLVVNEIQ
jgi:hypothetical protein